MNVIKVHTFCKNLSFTNMSLKNIQYFFTEIQSLMKNNLNKNVQQ